ncbi:MAG: hypothetical protein H6984_10600 [Pseudomonadales bacterium]|nr:hypothetical protein [Pseudomonadales bacterium]MCP5193848.1 hypothetical protein [Pseudomonadales bacterium]
MEEAEAQGCKLLRAGRSARYRLYSLPCGHDQEVELAKIRIGAFRCNVCLIEKLNREAEAQGCKLVGAGKKKDYCLYLPPCGHVLEVTAGNMRKGYFKCNTCLVERLEREAEAQGCKLLGAGKDANHRLYALACGHERELTTSNMRKGGFRCSICMADNQKRKADALGCKLLGVGKAANSHLYSLKCGHTLEIHSANMRKGGFRCSICFNEKVQKEAETLGCKLLGAGKSCHYRLYRLPCGHRQQMQMSAIRKNSFRCSICLEDKLKREAEAQGCKLLGAGKSAPYRLYRLPCGHRQQVQMGAMREGNFLCSICLEDKLKREAEAQGCKLLGAGKDIKFRLYALPCGHDLEVRVASMRDGSFKCSVCFKVKLEREAEAQGCKLLGAGTHANNRLYMLPCGHKQEIGVGNLRKGGFLCQICEETSRTLPSNVYLFRIKVDSDEWLKLGYAKSLDSRAAKYGLPESAQITTICSLPFDTGNEAHAVEAGIHKRYRRKRLTQKQMRDFHTVGGFNECYPVTMLETLLAELETVKRSRTS